MLDMPSYSLRYDSVFIWRISAPRPQSWAGQAVERQDVARLPTFMVSSVSSSKMGSAARSSPMDTASLGFEDYACGTLRFLFHSESM